MRYIVPAASFLLILTVDFPLAAQNPGPYPPGGGYPYPGGYPTGPRIPVPRRSKDKKVDDKSKLPELHSLTGVLQKIDDTSVTIVAQDTRTITAKRSDKTKVFKKGEESTAANLTNGARVRIEATQDEQGFYHAVAIHLEGEATPQEKAVSEKVDAVADSERTSPKTVIVDSSETVDPDRPRTRRGKPKPRPSAAPAETASAESTKPATPEQPAKAQSAPQAVASNKREPEVAWTEATVSREDPRIAKAREVVAAYTESLPNYFCQEQIARFASTTAKVDWRPLDVLSATVLSENGHDQYRDLKVNGKPVNKRMEDLGGAWSTGEFGNIVASLFAPGTAAQFTSRGSSRIANHDAVVYDFEVARENSRWHIQAASQSVQPAYRGSVWLKNDTAEVLRIEMQTYRMPKEFPLDKVESAVDYEYVRLGENRFLLPVHAETLTCVRGTNNCSRNVMDFRNYRKYAGESTITFDGK